MGQQKGRELGSPAQQGQGGHKAGRWDLGHQVPGSAQEPLAGGARGQEQRLPEPGLRLGTVSSRQGQARGTGKLRAQDSEAWSRGVGRNYQPRTAPSVPGVFVSIFSNYPHNHHLVLQMRK